MFEFTFMIILIFVYCSVAAFISGYKEGMIYLQDGDALDIVKGDKLGGVKQHKYTKAFYHNINLLVFPLIFLAGAFSYYLFEFKYIMYIFLSLGLIPLLYNFSEMGYSKARYNVFIPDYENFYFSEYINFKINGARNVLEAHTKRYILSISIIICIILMF